MAIGPWRGALMAGSAGKRIKKQAKNEYNIIDILFFMVIYEYYYEKKIKPFFVT
ncbi:MAG: hypothetical protein GY754_17945 [bacterium]|nr:hypothetical protein [bacterium]